MATASDPSADVPLFLRKTYHMIDTCPADIASWSEDGETFVVKDPTRFEQTIIPQLFKHSKFSSFVRQLNFYSFRKVKYHDSLRIDPEVEKETANYWRFRHENFQRGKPHLLTLIKRTQSAPKDMGPAGAGAASTYSSGSSSPQPDFPMSSSQINNDTAAEVQTLKMRIEQMTKNIDELSAMVKEVSLKQEDSDDYSGASVGYKRKKFSVESRAAALGNDPDEIRPDEMLSSMELDDIMALPVPSMPSIPAPAAGPVREMSTSTQGSSDLEFVDTFFTAFKDEPANEFDDVFIPEAEVPFQFSRLPSTGVAKEANESTNSSDRPDPELMKRLGDALMLLPKETQELIVNRLIAAITSADFMSNMSSSSYREAAHHQQNHGEGKVIVEDVVAEAPQTSDDEEKAPYPLAAATLAALLKHYSSQLQRGDSSASANKTGSVAKSIPVIPVHA